jgi:catechol 2,3-dioxygenase-like lactoylglutathione lyase family enzyme
MKTHYLFYLILVLTFSTIRAQDDYENLTVSIGVVVSDLEASIEFYTNIMGMEETGELDLDSSFGKASGLTGGRPLLVKILKLKNSPDATEYKLVSFGNDKKGFDKHIQDQNGMQYTTFFIKSTADIIKRIRENNIEFLGDTPIKLPDGRTFILIQDPDGVFIEIIGN